MVIISNSQRDGIVRYLREYAATASDGSTREFNARRLAGRLARQLERRPTTGKTPASEKVNKNGRNL